MAIVINTKETEGEIIIKKVTKVSLPEGISPDFLNTLTQVINEYDKTLKGLKDR